MRKLKFLRLISGSLDAVAIAKIEVITWFVT